MGSNTNSKMKVKYTPVEPEKKSRNKNRHDYRTIQNIQGSQLDYNQNLLPTQQNSPTNCLHKVKSSKPIYKYKKSYSQNSNSQNSISQTSPFSSSQTTPSYQASPS